MLLHILYEVTELRTKSKILGFSEESALQVKD